MSEPTDPQLAAAHRLSEGLFPHQVDGHYTLEVDSGDVTCSCRGFEFRGQCKHSRTLKESLTLGDPPDGFEPV